MASSSNSCRKCLGIFTRRERWGLSWRGWLLVAAIFIAGFVIAVRCVHPFLAITEPTDTKILVVEGWINQFTARAAATEFKAGGYERVFTTGGPVSGSGGYINDYDTVANVGAGLLRNAGVPANLVQMVPSRVMGRDRTYNSAIALRDWLRDHHLSVRSFNVLTEDAHARRSQMLFQEAFGAGVRVGIISVPSPDYDAKHWWRSSEGVREIIDESIAYIYAKFFFWPPKAKAESRNEPVVLFHLKSSSQGNEAPFNGRLPASDSLCSLRPSAANPYSTLLLSAFISA